MRPLLLELLCLTWVLLLAILTSRLQQPERIHQEMDHTNKHELAGRCGHIQGLLEVTGALLCVI